MSDVYKERWYVAEICNEPYIHRDGDNKYLAKVKEGETDEAWERANLMAAAPELLQAAEEVINLDGFVPNTISPEAKHVLLKAIQKARGESNE